RRATRTHNGRLTVLGMDICLHVLLPVVLVNVVLVLKITQATPCGGQRSSPVDRAGSIGFPSGLTFSRGHPVGRDSSAQREGASSPLRRHSRAERSCSDSGWRATSPTQ